MMRRWHEWRANVWAMRYLVALGTVECSRQQLPIAEKYDMREVQAEMLMSEGKCIYHRLRTVRAETTERTNG